MELDLDDKPRAQLNEKIFTPRTWFFGGFLGLFLTSIIQIVFSGVILNHVDHDHDDEMTENSAAANGAAADESLFFFDSDRQVWADSSRPPSFEKMSWSQVVEAARGTTVTWAVQLKFAGKNYVGENAGFFADELKRKFDITLNIVDAAAKDSTKQSVEKGDIDFIWLNKAWFIYLREQKNTWGPYATSLPNAALFDFTDEIMSSDFGIPTNGEEMPFHIGTYVMAYNNAMKPTVTTGSFPPKNIGELVEQVIKNEVRFHPARPDDNFLGQAFLEQVFYHYTGYDKKYREAFDEDWWTEQTKKVFPKLKEFHANLVTFTDKEGNITKYSSAKNVRAMFNASLVDLTAEYAPGAVFNRVSNGGYPKDTISFMFEEKMVSNTNFLTIPKSAPNKAGAMVAINLASSLEHQYKRFIPNEDGWKAMQGFNPFKKIVRQTGYHTVFDEIEQLEGAPTVEELVQNRVGEFNQEYAKRMMDDWLSEIGGGVDVKVN